MTEVSGSQTLQDLADFILARGYQHALAPEELLNLAVRHDYFWGDLYRNNKKKAIHMAGPGVDVPLLFRGGGTYQEKSPHEEMKWKRTKGLKKALAPWSFASAHMTLDDYEIELDPMMAYDGPWRADKFADVATIKETREAIDLVEGIETAISRAPDYSTMELTNTAGETRQPFSVFAHVNEYANGIYAGDSDWTTNKTKMGLDPTSSDYDSKWQPWVETYTDVKTESSGNSPIIGNLDFALDQAFLDVQFTKPPMLQQYFNDQTLNNQKIRTSKMGRAVFAAMRRGSPDRVMADVGGSTVDPLCNGVPVARWEAMDTVAMYKDNTSAYVTEGKSTLDGTSSSLYGGPRFLVLNCNFMYPVFHKNRMFKRSQKMQDFHVTDEIVIETTVWWQLPCFSYMHQAIVRPGATAVLTATGAY